ncbi:hypothetical protein NC652_030039 [Populus alba x Populus x berolinensis]|nr:hypothetical protein NC652_030039 [Populus alba x Populus x berolinensis]
MLAHFDEWQRTRQDDIYEEAQDQWPTELRHERVIPAVDYVQALALAMASQSVTDHHKQHPPIDNLGPNDGIPDPPTLIITESFLIKIFCILTLLLCGSDEVPIISYYLIKFFNQSRSYYCGRAMKLQWMK